MKRENLNPKRRQLLACLPVICYSVTHSDAIAQLHKSVFSQFEPTKSALENAKSLEEIGVIANEWNSIYREHATSLEPEFATDVQQIIDFINGKISDSIRDAALAEALKKAAPIFFEKLSTSLAWLKNIGPIMLFIEVSAPSKIASDSVELYHTNQGMQAHIRTAIDRIIPMENQWYDTTKTLIKFPDGLPTMGPK